MKLNIGCGRDYREGWVNIDISQEVKADEYLDIRREHLDIEDNAADEVYISGVLEQIGENEHLSFAINECHRALKPGGIMTVVVPNATYAIAHQDPMDVRKFTPKTFDYLLKGNRHYELYGSVYGFNGWSGLEITENARHILTVCLTK